MKTGFAAGVCLALAFGGSAQASEWDLCPTLTTMQVYGLIGRTDLVSMSTPQMIHGTCTSLATTNTGAKIGISITFNVSIFDTSGADPNTNPNPTQYPVSLQQWQNQNQPAPLNLSKDVATCVVQARVALGTTMADINGHTQNEQIDGYVAQGKVYFNNPFVSQNPTFAFWKCLRLKGYNFPPS